ncbi:muscle M-line assembly protein unc-89-like isoform X1 [Drosophila miranda]|uniref:muscle M-line assembly protein unc-89-like isoform X1 n=1 Tax=Drosophila miranda TaxID=7229 RepID=UPI00143F0D35|nr:muscle M-line assembly protein unc-89-like isoform X1 [Drosophila miranda]
MGETDGDIEPRASAEPDAPAAQDTLQVPTQKKRKLKSPTPGSLRGRSSTPIHGRSQTPFTLYMTRRSATPSTWRSITPFLNREKKEKTPFELGRDIKSQTTCNIAVFDRALGMDISEPLDVQKPVRYITSDLSVIDRAAVMDVSNVEVIYVVEEYEEFDEEEILEEVKPKKKEKKARKPRVARKSVDMTSDSEDIVDGLDDREDSLDLDDDEPVKKGKKKAPPKKKEKSPSPKLSLKLEIGGAQKASKKMFEQQQQAGPKPPPKKSKMVLQMEEQAKAAAKAAEEEANRAKPKGETFEERQKRLQAEKEEQERLEAEQRALEEAEEEEEPPEEGEDGTEAGYGDEENEYLDENGEENPEDLAEEEEDVVVDLKKEKRRGSDSSDDFVRPDPHEEERWQRIAAIEGEEFMQQMRKYSMAKRISEKERDADWQNRREQGRRPKFINFLSDRTVECGQSVRLACAVDGPELSAKWFKDRRQLERDGCHRISNNNNILVLEVLNTNILDSGEYSCVISNQNDEVISSCIVTVYEVFKDEPKPPTIQYIKEYYHLRDDELTIECHVHGVPRPVITWWRGAFQVKPSYKFTMLEEAHGVCKLLIYKPGNKDGGIYTLKAINSIGEVQINHTVEVAKNLHYHVPGIFHARDRIQLDSLKHAKRQMDTALKSMAESDQRRAEAEQARLRPVRPSPEPLVPAKQKLSFATQLRDRMALEGSTIKFVATVIGPSPSTRWMKDDKWVVVGGNIKNLSEEGKAILAIENATTADSGVYKCVAKNELSEIETSCYFKVYAAQTDGDESEPIFALPLRDVYHASQNDLIIDTKVRCNPRPVITWTKDQIPVVLDDRVVQIEHLDGICELIINKPTVNDNGIYVCSAQNKLGSQSTTHTVVVDTHSSRRSSILSTLAMQDGAKEGEAAEGGGKAKSRPKKKKDDEEEAGGGGGGDGGYERRSRMPDPSPKQMLYFTVNLSNRYVAEGSKVKLQAVIGGPEPTLKWQKDDQNVSYGPRIRNMNRNGLAVLEFVNASTEDSGTYTITAQNEHCKITTSAVLHVYEAKVNTDVQPVFIRSLKDTYHLNTNELILETAVRGQPTPEVQWFKDSIEIQSGGRFQLIEHQDGSCELHIDRPDNKDSGKYVVKAESRAGKMEISHYVLFESMAHHIADNIHGVFHADKNLLRAKEEKEKPSEDCRKPAPAAAAPEAESEAETEEGKGKRRGHKADDDEGVSSAYASDYASDSGSISSKRREKNIVIHFSTSMRDRVVAEGSKVKISCFLDAKEPQVKWFKDGEQLVNGPKIRGRYSEGLCLLEITSATAEDNGEFKCWGRDETGEASTSCRLEVFEDAGTGDVPPTFTRNIKDTLHGKINELQLDVHVRGLPTPSVTWVKDGVKIENSDKYQQVDHDDGTCELFISSPKPSDSGKYVCQAENREGKTEIVHMVTVEKRVRAPRISPPREGRPPRPAGEGDEPAAGEEGEVGADGEPRRRKPKPDEEEVTSSRREVPMPPDLRKRLYFRNYLSNRTVKSGSNVKWMVNIDGPEPSAKWFHGDQPIAFGPKSKLSMQDGIAWLNLVGVTEEDAGEYTLRVRGSDNEIVSTCNLFVYSTGKEEIIPPTFVVGIKDTYSLNENELVLDCRVRGQPRPDITWMKGNEILSSDEKYQLTDQADGDAKLVIVSPTEKDSGVSSCVARNEGAENKMSHQVDFKGRERYTQEKTSGFYHRDPNKPHFLTPLGNQTVCDGGTVAISAEFMQTTTPLEVKWLRDRQVVEGPNVQALADRGVYTLTIMKATSEVEGTYTCRASNAYGRTESHANVDVAVGAEKDERPPLFLSRPDTEMKIAVGDPFSFAFRIAGEPKPKLTFMKGTKDITQSDRVSKEVSDDYTRFTVQQAQISDSGTYFVVARNNFGTDRIFVTVTVNPRARSATPTQPRWDLPLDSYSDSSYFRDRFKNRHKPKTTKESSCEINEIDRSIHPAAHTQNISCIYLLLVFLND